MKAAEITDCLERKLQELAARVARNAPSHRDPEAFHVEKDEIANALRRLATEARHVRL
jgi:hypothetical protein